MAGQRPCCPLEDVANILAGVNGLTFFPGSCLLQAHGGTAEKVFQLLRDCGRRPAAGDV